MVGDKILMDAPRFKARIDLLFDERGKRPAETPPAGGRNGGFWIFSGGRNGWV